MAHVRARDLVGQRYFRLVIAERFPNHGHSTKWKAICDCGTEIEILGCNWGKKIKSCGCLQKETKNDPKPDTARPSGEAARRQIVNSYVGNARSRAIEFNLTYEQVTILFQGNCHYCGSAPSSVRKGRFGYGDYIYNGIDRIDSSLSYNWNNVVSCCWRCNRAKSNSSYEQFMTWIAGLTAYRVQHHPAAAE
jgi:hypothetical protein